MQNYIARCFTEMSIMLMMFYNEAGQIQNVDDKLIVVEFTIPYLVCITS